MAAALSAAAATVGCIGPLSSDGGTSLDESALRRHVEYLAADSTFGRLTGSIHELQVAGYIRDRFVEYGLGPGTPGYFQTLPVVGGKFPVGAGCLASPTQTGDPSRVSQNVIGTFPGRGGLAGEWIAVSAHYDHLGCVDDPAGVVVYNGADDNASGTSLLLEMARAIVASDGDLTADRRSVMFIAFGAEEPGLIGSQFFVANPPVSIASIVGVVNLDMVGRLRDARLTIAGTTVAQGWETVLEAQNTDDLRLNYDDAFLLRGDHYSFIQAGTPSVHVFTESHNDYHQPTDVTDGIDFGGLVTVGEFSLRVVTALRLSRVPIAN